MRPLNGVTNDDTKKKIKIYKICNFAKSRMDIVGHFNGYYTVRFQSNRWDLVASYRIFDKIELEFKFVNDIDNSKLCFEC